MFLVRFIPRLIWLLQSYAVTMTKLRLAWPRPLWRLLRVVDVLVANAAAWSFVTGIAIFTRTLRPTLRANDSGRLPDVKVVWERYLRRSTFVGSESVTGLHAPFGNFIVHSLYRRPARFERLDVATDIGIRQRLSLRLLYAGYPACMRHDGSLDPDISAYPGGGFNTGFSVCLKLLVDTHNAFVRELRGGWGPFPSLAGAATDSPAMTFAEAAALNWHTCVNFVENDYFRSYAGFQAPFAFKYFNTARARVCGFPRLRAFLSEKLRVGMLGHLSYRPHWLLRDEISPRIPYAIGGVGEASCHEAVAALGEQEIASLFLDLVRSAGGAAVPRNIPEFLERPSIDALTTGRRLCVSYNDVLRALRIPAANSFDRFRDGGILQQLYGDVDDVDFPVGLIGDRLLIDRAVGAEASYVMVALLVLTVLFDELFGWSHAGDDDQRDAAGHHEEVLRHAEAKWEALFACSNCESVAGWVDWVYGRAAARPPATGDVSLGEQVRVKDSHGRFRENMRSLSAALRQEQARLGVG